MSTTTEKQQPASGVGDSASLRWKLTSVGGQPILAARLPGGTGHAVIAESSDAGSIADTIAQRLSAKRRADGRWATSTVHCHGGDNPDQLLFWSPPPGEPDKLLVQCGTRGCHHSDYNGVRDRLRSAAGVGSFTPDQSPARRATRPNPLERARARRSAPKAEAAEPSDDDKRTWVDADAVWKAAIPSSSGPAQGSPPALWLDMWNVWPPGQKLPKMVRWLPESQFSLITWSKYLGGAAGAFVLGMPRWGRGQRIRKVAIVAIGAKGEKVRCFTSKRGDSDKVMRGRDAPGCGWLMHYLPDEWLPGWMPDLHIVEGLKDGLALLSGMAVSPDLKDVDGWSGPVSAWQQAHAANPVVCVCHRKVSTNMVNPDDWASVTLWPDADGEGLEAARRAADSWSRAGHRIAITHCPDGQDPGDYARSLAHG